MARSPLADQDLYPPFEGFPRQGIQFLTKLKKNNNRPWFQKHKAEYEENVRFPMQCLIASLSQQMAGVAPEFSFDPKRSIFRIYRDVRFSNNKAPYKTNIAASFELRGKKGPTENPGFYLGIEPGEIFVGGGVYMPTGPQLKAIRTSVAEHPQDFLEIVENRAFKKRFGEIMGEKLQKAPLGYPRDHPMIHYLRYKQWFIGVEWGHTECFSPKFVDRVADVLTDALPFIRWLLRASA
ncbi:MAG TPA: DUF2461 domain-containing protein [Bacteroidota bacterium]|nr:DUF2461 domain-containing protein [Bacteroidota bacterium]